MVQQKKIALAKSKPFFLTYSFVVLCSSKMLFASSVFVSVSKAFTATQQSFLIDEIVSVSFVDAFFVLGKNCVSGFTCTVISLLSAFFTVIVPFFSSTFVTVPMQSYFALIALGRGVSTLPRAMQSQPTTQQFACPFLIDGFSILMASFFSCLIDFGFCAKISVVLATSAIAKSVFFIDNPLFFLIV